jgi:hypothetical protein
VPWTGLPTAHLAQVQLLAQVSAQPTAGTTALLSRAEAPEEDDWLLRWALLVAGSARLEPAALGVALVDWLAGSDVTWWRGGWQQQLDSGGGGGDGGGGGGGGNGGGGGGGAVAAVMVAAVMVVVGWVGISQWRVALVKPTMMSTWRCEWEATECCEAASTWSSTRTVLICQDISKSVISPSCKHHFLPSHGHSLSGLRQPFLSISVRSLLPCRLSQVLSALCASVGYSQ